MKNIVDMQEKEEVRAGHGEHATHAYAAHHVTHIYLVRHAEPVSHIPDGGLTELGCAQAKKVAEFITSKHPPAHKTVLIVSPTMRTRLTADPLCEILRTRPLTHSAFSEEYLVDSVKSFISPAFLMHHVSSRRILHAFRHVVHKNLGKTIIIVTHGNVIRVLLGKLLRKSYNEMSQIPVTCASVSEIIVEDHPVSLKVTPNICVL